MAKKYDVKALREKVLSSEDIQYGEVYVEEWDVTLPVKTLSAAEMKKVMRYKKDEVRMMILAALYGCVAEDGEQVFKEEDLAQFESKKAFAPVSRVASKVFDLSGFTDKADGDAKN